MSIYNLIKEYEDIQSDILNGTEEEQEAAIERLTLTESEIENKLPYLARLVKNVQAEADAYKAEADRLYALHRSRANAVERIKSLIRDAMIVTGKEKIKTDIGTYSLQKNPVSCNIVDWHKLPEQYLVHSDPTVDKKAVVKWYKETGEVLPGTEIKQEMGLRFR